MAIDREQAARIAELARLDLAPDEQEVVARQLSQVLDFVATGGYALKAYERFAKIRQTKDGRWRVANPMVAQRYRMNVGTIVEADMLKVRLVRSRAGGAGHTGPIARGGRLLGEVRPMPDPAIDELTRTVLRD